MNILVICHYGLYRNPENSFVHSQACAYVKLGHRVRVVVPVALGKNAWEQGRWRAMPYERDGVEIYPIRYLSISKMGNGWLNLWTVLAAVYCQKIHLLGGFSAEVIHAHHMGFDSAVGAIFRRYYKVPMVVTTHGSDTAIPFERGKLRALYRICKQADTIVAVSEALADKLRQCGTSTPIHVILNGFQSGYVNPDCEKKPRSVIQVGNLIPSKRFSVTIDAFAKFYRQYPDATLTIIGNGPERERLKEQCRALGIADAVRFLGQLPNQFVLKELASHQFFVMPSVREGFGIVYLEAMASGCLTIGIEGEGIGSFLHHGENGYLLPPDSPDSIADRLCYCCEHPEETYALTQQGKADALHQTWEKNAGEYLELFKSLIRNED